MCGGGLWVCHVELVLLHHIFVDMSALWKGWDLVVLYTHSQRLSKGGDGLLGASVGPLRVCEPHLGLCPRPLVPASLGGSGWSGIERKLWLFHFLKWIMCGALYVCVWDPYVVCMSFLWMCVYGCVSSPGVCVCVCLCLLYTRMWVLHSCPHLCECLCSSSFRWAVLQGWRGGCTMNGLPVCCLGRWLMCNDWALWRSEVCVCVCVCVWWR